MRRAEIDVADGVTQTVDLDLRCDSTIPWSLTITPVTTATGTVILEGKNSDTLDKWFTISGGEQSFTSDGVMFYKNGLSFKYFRARFTGLSGSGLIHLDSHNVITQRV